MIKAVIFDMDGVLIDSEPLWQKAGVSAFTSINIPMTQKLFTKTMGMRIDHVVGFWFEKFHIKNHSKRKIEEKVHQKVLELVKNKGKLALGAKSALEICKEKKLKIGLASSTHLHMIKTILKSLNIVEYFDEIHSAEFEKKGKPDPGVFLTTAKKLGVKPENCLVVEDAPVGVEAAKSANMRCAVIPNPHHKNDKRYKKADIVLKSLKDFSEQLFNNLSD